MGITSSKEEYHEDEEINIRSDRFMWEKLESMNPEEWPEEERVKMRGLAEPIVEKVFKDLSALFPPKLGESSTDQPKEIDPDDEVLERFREFMKGGACKESYTAFEDCAAKNTDRIVNCTKHVPMLIKCVDAHSEYYQPIISLGESAVEQLVKDVKAEVAREQAEG